MDICQLTDPYDPNRHCIEIVQSKNMDLSTLL
jgi:hypothetical protein